MKKITVVGSGSWGTAIAVLLNDKGYNVTLWSWKQEECDAIQNDGENKEFLPGIKIDEKIKLTSDISCVADKDLIVLVSPSRVIRDTAKKMAPHIKNNTPIVILSKGLEDKTLKTLSQIVEEEIPSSPVAALSGPSHAEEVAKKVPTTCVVACKDLKVAEYIQEVFMCPYFRVYTNDDILGVEIGGALKNVIALCAGITDGIGFGDNTKAALMTRGIKEISRLGVKMGAKESTFYGLTGIGDLIVTCTSMHSRNRRAGILIGQGNTLNEALEKVHMVVEGVYSAGAAYELSKKYEVEMPIVEKAYDVLFNNLSPKEAVLSLMKRNKKDEIV
ncbi:MAG: NAD(P)H-dependent glycerol-3-phosphate dehydrogenase [Ruminococcaceae bacterium]|nr:NAD(P)H-dependent glycerol-3-phosphate dehydrogenase [Oscillospiraceae bacterium]